MRCVPIALCAVAALTSLAHSDDAWVARLQPANPAHADSFGAAVALAGDDLLAVGAPDALGTGVVIIFRRDANGWHEDAVLLPPTPSIDARFGESLLFWGGGLLVGAPHASDGGPVRHGAVHAYDLDVAGGWSFAWTMRAIGPVADGNFGAAMLRHAPWLWIGEPGDGGGSVSGYLDGSTSGAPPNFDQGLSAGGVGARFGASLAPASYSWAASLCRVLFIGAPGARSVYVATEWHENVSAHFAVSDPSIPGFGKHISSAVGLEGGVSERIGVGCDAGTVEVYDDHDFGDWAQHHTTIQPFDSTGSTDFGASFLMFRTSATSSGWGMIIGDPTGQMGPGIKTGGAYRYAFEDGAVIDLGGLAPRTLSVEEGAGASIAAVTHFGGVVTTVALGAPSAGAVHIFAPSGLLGRAWCSSVTNTLDQRPVLYGLGSDEVAARSFQTVAVGLPPRTFMAMIASPNALEVPFGYGSAGLRCIGPPFYRFAGQISRTSVAGVATVYVDPMALPFGGAIAPGETWTFQVWYRDEAATTTSNTTHALQVTFR